MIILWLPSGLLLMGIMAEVVAVGAGSWADNVLKVDRRLLFARDKSFHSLEAEPTLAAVAAFV